MKPFLLFVFALTVFSCSKSIDEKTSNLETFHDTDSIVTINKRDTISWETYQSLDLCEKLSFDKWIFTSPNINPRLVRNYPFGQVKEGGEGMTSPLFIDSLIFKKDSLFINGRGFYEKEEVCFPMTCQQDVLSTKGFTVFTFDHIKIDSLWIKMESDTSFTAIASSPLYHYSKGSDYFNYRYEYPYDVVINTRYIAKP